MNFTDIEIIVREELQEAEARISARLRGDDNAEMNIKESLQDSALVPKTSLPDNENYAIALELYEKGETHSGVARQLGVSINAVKKYYNWLVNHEYLPIVEAELSDAEQKVIDCIFKRKMSLRETAQALNCSVTNVVYRRDSALRKGYDPDKGIDNL